MGEVLSEGISNYNGLQTSFQRRFSKGLALDANYTWSKALSDIAGFSQENDNQGFADANPFNLRADRIRCRGERHPEPLCLSLNYQFQYGQGWYRDKEAGAGGMVGQHHYRMAKRQAILGYQWRRQQRQHNLCGPGDRQHSHRGIWQQSCAR